MKTLKKTLCLVLAVVMVVGVLILPAHAADATTVDADAEAAFKTLFGYGVMKGVDTKNTPALDKAINRQDMAAIVYRIMTGDTSGTYKDNYAGTAEKFADSATFAKWAKGYIGYVRSKGIFVGDDNGNFKPEALITGDEVLTVLLRCIGYGQNNEFSGTYWAENAETLATQIHLFGGTNRITVKADVSKSINRGVVAKLTCNAIQAPMVTIYNGAYSDSNVDGRPVAPNTPKAEPNLPLIQKTTTTAAEVTYDAWGVPSKATTTTISFNYPNVKVTSESKEDLKPMTTFWTAKSHCDVCDEISVDTKIETSIDVYTNGKSNKTKLTVLDPVNTQAQIGAQGRYTAIYDTNGDKKPDVIVYKDTLLAKVTDVKDATFDSKGHLKTEASLWLNVYANDNNATNVKKTNKSTNYTYKKGDYVLVNAIHTGDRAISTTGTDITIVDVPTTVSGVQSRVWYNADKHTVSGTDYNDNNRFHLNEANVNTSNSYTWFFDTKGNLIGAVKNATAHAYGVITSMWWNDGTDGVGYAQAKVTYVDGTTATLTVGSMTVAAGDGIATKYVPVVGTSTQGDANGDPKPMHFDSASAAAGNRFYVNESAATNAAKDNNGIIAGNLFQINTDSKGVSSFVEVAGQNKNAIAANNNAEAYTGLSSTTTAVSKGIVDNYIQTLPNTAQTAGDHLYINEDTVFLIRSGNAVTGYTFTSVTGYKNIADFNPGEVDFVNVDDDDYAEYVYITATPVAESGWHIFFADATIVHDQSGDSAQMRYSEDASKYTVYGYLDGVANSSVNIRKARVNGTNNADDAIVADFINKANGNTLWLVKIVGGYVVDVNGAKSNVAGNSVAVNGSTTVNWYVGPSIAGYYDNAQALKSADGMDANLTGSYADKSIIFVSAATTVTKDSDSVLSVGTTKYTLGDNCLVFGDWAELSDADTTMVLVYKTSNKTVTQAYIIAKDDGTEYNPGTTLAEKTTYTIGLQSDGKNIGSEVALYAATSKGTAADALKAALANANEVKVATFGTGDEHTFKAVASNPAQAEIAFANSTAGFTVSALTITSASEFTTKVYVGDYIVIAWAASGTTPTHFAAFKVVA